MVSMRNFIAPAGVLAAWAGVCALSAAEDWKPAKGPLMTRWAKDVSPDDALPEYPRPQLMRKEWQNLNGMWQYAIRPKNESRPEAWDGEILVPFPIESALSGVMKTVGADHKLWYRRTFKLPAGYQDRRIMLHFGAADWESVVFLNGRRIADHRGGYDPFSIDISASLKPDSEQELVVAVWDPSDKAGQPRGKQIEKPHGIWYTPVTGIWQTVWLEPLPVSYIRSVQMTPNVDTSSVTFTVETAGGSLAAGPERKFKAVIMDGEKEAVSGTGKGEEPLTLKIPDAKLWSPDKPFLYDVRVELDGGDNVASYVGIRKIAVGKDSAGHKRMFLNNQPLFQLGPLDQGWWPDGLYTAPTDEALRYDIEITKKLGFNMCRKHVKVEPERWYYWCDKLGLLVWQDMPNGDRHIGDADPDIVRTRESEETYRREWEAIINARRNHPSIVVWVPFNEGWGQFKTNEILEWTKSLDRTRLIDGPSGWTDRGVGDLHDMHAYPGPGMPQTAAHRVPVLGEFGGLGLPLEGHLWVNRDNWGYQNFKDKESLATAYKNLYYKMQGLYAEGLAAAVYTQTTDVEIEVNGLLTYDRAVLKVPESVADLHRTFYRPPPKIKELAATSREKPQTWRYVTTEPATDWKNVDFDDAAWKEGPGGFGTKETPNTVVRTEWNTGDIWLRRTFKVTEKPAGELRLKLYHDEDAEIYLNGRKVAAVTGYTTGYIYLPLDAGDGKSIELRDVNTLAVHCKQTRGGQYIDVGLDEVRSE